ncbi:MAG: LacI family DNA-binding transcriptional regulator [Pseudolysinimonas sp.]|uniref:LacI family DNA-binding transcriptional regulator n=1 Tax=Pseudolysinimonas sp. TaxID=2680009 RepID=UPI00326662E7
MSTETDGRGGSDEKSRRAANIFDVARLAGVSHQTVSRVLNDLPNVRTATRLRVEQAIAQLRYSPSPAARALVTRRTRTIGLIVPGTSDYGPNSTALHFNFAARAARFSVDTVSALDADPVGIRAAIDSLLRQRVDAIVLVVTDVSVLETVLGLDMSVPLVAVAASARPSSALVSFDQYRGARAAVRHLIELGHTRILHVAGPAEAPDAIERMRGWRDELATNRLAIAEVMHADWTAADGYQVGTDLAAAVPGTAIFAANDHIALGIVSALTNRGMRVPDDVSIVGFGDVPEAGYLAPPLTTVRQDYAALGGLIMQKVLIAIEEPDAASVSTPLATHLVVRASTAPPNATAR